MAEALTIEISTNVTENPFEKHYPSLLTLGDLKKKLELVVGAVAESIKVDLFDGNGKFVSALSDDTRTLKDLGVKTGMRLHAVDLSGANEDLNDDSMVEKYEMSDDTYNQREDSVRAWKKKLMAQQGISASGKKDPNPNEEAARKITVGSRCEVQTKGNMARRGEVAFVGPTKFKEGLWVGIKYDEPVGKNDGSVAGIRYFACDDKYGGFVRPVDVICGDFPELEIDEI